MTKNIISLEAHQLKNSCFKTTLFCNSSKQVIKEKDATRISELKTVIFKPKCWSLLFCFYMLLTSCHIFKVIQNVVQEHFFRETEGLVIMHVFSDHATHCILYVGHLWNINYEINMTLTIYLLQMTNYTKHYMQ